MGGTGLEPVTPCRPSKSPIHIRNQQDFPPRVYFNEINANSLNILVVYWFHPFEYWEYLEHYNAVNIPIMERSNTEGIKFVFPTQTLHLEGGVNTTNPRRKTLWRDV